MYLGARRRYINTLPFLSFPFLSFPFSAGAGVARKWRDRLAISAKIGIGERDGLIIGPVN